MFGQNVSLCLGSREAMHNRVKENARILWEETNKPDRHVLGFTSEEKDRHDRFTLTERDNVIPILIDARMTKADCYRMLKQAQDRATADIQAWLSLTALMGKRLRHPHTGTMLGKSIQRFLSERAKQSRDIGSRLKKRIMNEYS